MTFSDISAYDAFCKAHKSVMDSVNKAHRPEECRRRFLRARYALHLAFSKEEIHEACDKFLNVYFHKV